MWILGPLLSWGYQLIYCLDSLKFLYLSERFFLRGIWQISSGYCLVWKLPYVCDIQVVAKESLRWEKALFLSVQFQVNFILDIQSQRWVVLQCSEIKVLDTVFLLKLNFLFLLWFFKCCTSYAHALLHLHPINVTSSSFPINTLLRFPWCIGFCL